ncbi:Uncharacterized protein BM_BM17109 [Brugia malayi]|uniref:Uncharacterized protein n=1 Tax=Brugia malayi TaxID=6279 RepID=A0A4E9FRS5_BRUMA|nr:Uncharacterized protein BM_BM17109 [Brugia malayi]VIO99913.1 Uncharacterized protein BM_BM17109 [Brugia malayi]
MERVLRQLEAIGENVEQPTIETIIESKLPNWILNQVYQQKEEDGQCKTRGTASAERNQLNQENPIGRQKRKGDPVSSAITITGIASVTYILQWSSELID